MRQFSLALLALLWGSAASASGAIGNWSVTETAAALTGAPTVVAQVDSEEQLLNQIGAPERASLVMRCQDGSLALYVSWPQVMNHDNDSILLNMPETMVRYKVDDDPIKTDFWVMDNSMTAAGSFDNVGAPKLIKALLEAHRLVVRLAGENTQDATFDVDGVLFVAQRVVAACTGKPMPPLSDEPPPAAAAQQPAPQSSLPAAIASVGHSDSSSASPGGAVLGASFIDLPPDLAIGLSRPGLKGAFIVGVAAGSVAETSGLHPGDIVVSYDAKPVAGKDDLVAGVRGTKLGAAVVVALFRAGKDMQVTLNYGTPPR
ncbi:MAG TPA: PDZ domain-containing protein [Caulobacteraceae bacterium]|jgi:hypothetical protein